MKQVSGNIKVTCYIFKCRITILGPIVRCLCVLHIVSTNSTLLCVFRYPEFRDREGHFTAFYWHLLALRLGFVIMFEVRRVYVT